MCNLLLGMNLFSKFLAEFRKNFVSSVPDSVPDRNFDSGSTLFLTLIKLIAVTPLLSSWVLLLTDPSLNLL